MKQDNPVTWDERYKGNEFLSEKTPTRFLVEKIHLLPKGKALDIAAGAGRNSLFLAQQGFQVEAMDISEQGLKNAQNLFKKKGAEIKTVKADLENCRIENDTYDVIGNFYYLQRSLIPKIKRGLKKGGAVIFETYHSGQAEIEGGPKNPEYLLGDNELLHFFHDFRVIYYREGIFSEKRRKKALASIIAVKN